VRDVRQGPDGLLYIVTDEDDGALLRIEPAP
jgi:aldose sugar dehydrogenase